jgi:hypothetical protein
MPEEPEISDVAADGVEMLLCSTEFEPISGLVGEFDRGRHRDRS